MITPLDFDEKSIDPWELADTESSFEVEERFCMNWSTLMLKIVSLSLVIKDLVLYFYFRLNPSVSSSGGSRNWKFFLITASVLVLPRSASFRFLLASLLLLDLWLSYLITSGISFLSLWPMFRRNFIDLIVSRLFWRRSCSLVE